ncbi:hypothetical protein ACQZ6V_23635 [Agrobacterium sp. 22-3674b3]
MPPEQPTARKRIWSIIKVIWIVSIIMVATGLGAVTGWETHGIVGAIVLGFVGLVVGIFLSSPTLLLQVIP